MDKTSIFNLSGNQNKNKESQASFLWTWLGEEGIKELGYYDWSETDRANSDKIFTKLKETIHPVDNTEIYRNQFYKLKQNAPQTFSDFYFEILCIYELCKFEDEARCTEQKNCVDCKKTIKDAQLKDIIYIAVRDHKLMEEFKKIKGDDNTFSIYFEAGNSWDTANATRGAFDQTKTLTTQDIHAISNHQNKINSNNTKDNNGKFIKLCRNCGKGHKIKQCPAKDKPCNKCNIIGHCANKCRSSPSILQGSQVQRLQRKSFTKPHQGSKPVLSRNEPIHLMTADGCIGVSDFSTIDDNFDNIQWIDFIEVSYNPATNQSTYKVRSQTAAIHNIQQRQKSQAFTTVGILPEDTEGKITAPAIETKCKIDTGTAVNVMPISTFRKLCPAMFDANGNALDKFSKEWTTVRAYGGGIIKQFGTRMIKCKWNYKKLVLLFHTVDVEAPTLLGLKTLGHMGIFSKHPRVYIETIDLHSMNLVLASKQPKEAEDGQN